MTPGPHSQSRPYPLILFKNNLLTMTRFLFLIQCNTLDFPYFNIQTLSFIKLFLICRLEV